MIARHAHTVTNTALRVGRRWRSHRIRLPSACLEWKSSRALLARRTRNARGRAQGVSQRTIFSIHNTTAWSGVSLLCRYHPAKHSRAFHHPANPPRQSVSIAIALDLRDAALLLLRPPSEAPVFLAPPSLPAPDAADPRCAPPPLVVLPGELFRNTSSEHTSGASPRPPSVRSEPLLVWYVPSIALRGGTGAGPHTIVASMAFERPRLRFRCFRNTLC